MIGEPVATTPGLGPQEDNDADAAPPDALVPVPPADELELEAASALLDVELPAAAELELLLLPHPANARTPIATTRAATNRLRDA
ncbi:MAG TPA: hypothetical protein VIK04_00540 [Solirubrobacteraceae bacterium]